MAFVLPLASLIYEVRLQTVGMVRGGSRVQCWSGKSINGRVGKIFHPA